MVRESDKICCPCRKCSNSNSNTLKFVEWDLIIHEIDRSYNLWIHHEEDFETNIYNNRFDETIQEYELLHQTQNNTATFEKMFKATKN